MLHICLRHHQDAIISQLLDTKPLEVLYLWNWSDETQRNINMLSYVWLIMGGSFFIHSISINVTHFLLYLHWIYYTHVLYLHSYIRFMYIFILHNHFLLDRSIRLLHPLRLKLFTSFFRIPLRSPQKGLYN